MVAAIYSIADFKGSATSQAVEVFRGYSPGNAALAQSVERLTRNEKVKGSIPLGGSKNGDRDIASRIGLHNGVISSLTEPNRPPI